MAEKKSKVPVVTLEKGDKDSAKEFKGTASKGPFKDVGSHAKSKAAAPMSQRAQKGPMLRGKK